MSDDGERPSHEHVVQFYDDDSFLLETVAKYGCSGIAAGETILIIATREHREALHERFAACAPVASADAQIVMVDARETLNAFMVGDEADPARFDDVVGGLLRRTRGARPTARVRAYGEMVDLLCRDGRASAAIELEKLWNGLAAKETFSLLCAYVLDAFVRSGGSEAYQRICDEHGVVLPTERLLNIDGDRLRLRAVADLEQRARVLETESKAASDAACFRLLVQSVRDYAIFMLDPTGCVTSWNAGAERLKGYRADEIIGKHFSVFYPREDVAAGKCERELDEATREGRCEDEGWRVRKDGTRFMANVVLTAMHDGDTLVGFAKVTRDVTDRVRGEQERLRLAYAEAAGRHKDQFFAIMGHELRNPLAAMVTAVHLIKLRGAKNCDKEIAVLERQLSQMTRLLGDLLDVSRAMRDEIVLSPKVMEIGEVLANAIEVASPLIEKNHDRLRVDVPPKGLRVNVDPERITQVFGNLLSNAAKYTPRGGEIRIKARASQERVEVTIEDTGQGIAPEMLTMIFELFAQAGERSEGGLGIGLAIARRLVNEHGGEITAESAGLGKGSSFRVRLPRAPSVLTEEPSASQPPAHHNGAPKRVLIVDDNPDAASMLRAVLELGGHEVLVVHDGAHALASCTSFAPELVFLDIDLPDMTGYDVVERMRDIPCLATVPIIALTGYAQDADRSHAMQVGFSDHLAKPVDIGRIEAIVQEKPRG